MSEFRAAKHNFSPVIEKDSRMLFLGSVPSVASEKAGFFYMHKTNRFWRILGKIFGENFYDASIEQKISLLKKHRVALYDSIESCEISGSSDSTIKNVVPADIPALLSLSEIKRIFCVGTASRKYLLEFYLYSALLLYKYDHHQECHNYICHSHHPDYQYQLSPLNLHY